MQTPRPELELMATIADELPVAIWLGKVPGGEVQYVNRAFGEVLGITAPPEGAERGNYVATYGIYRKDGTVYAESDMPYERCVRAGTVVVVDDLVIHHSDGRRIHLRVWAKPLRDAAGNITHVLEAFTDITAQLKAQREQAEAEERLRHAQRMETVGTLAGGIAHDFNNLLATLQLLASSAQVREQDPKRLEIFRQFEKVAGSGLTLTKGLLSFARRGKTDARLFGLKELVLDTTSLLRRTMDRRIELQVDLRTTAAVMGDWTQLEQVLMNLVLNARDAIPGNGRITVRTQDVDAPPGLPAGRFVALEVEDTGTGIPEKLRGRVFEPYFTTKTEGPQRGTGLGLATVEGIVKEHGGRVEVARTGPEGTVMRVYLPAAEGVVSEEPHRSTGVTRGTGTVLVVDDEPMIRAALTSALAAAGYGVLDSADGPSAVELYRVQRGSIAAVIVDLTLRNFDGRQTLHALRAIDPKVPVLFTTGPLADDGERLLEEGAAGVLSKPFDLAKLSETVARAIENTPS